jgi:hypothetical protein
MVMTYRISLNTEEYRKVLEYWEEDYDEEGYDYPFVEMWLARRFNGKFTLRSVSERRAVVTIKDAALAVEFKLMFK